VLGCYLYACQERGVFTATAFSSYSQRSNVIKLSNYDNHIHQLFQEPGVCCINRRRVCSPIRKWFYFSLEFRSSPECGIDFRRSFILMRRLQNVSSVFVMPDTLRMSKDAATGFRLPHGYGPAGSVRFTTIRILDLPWMHRFTVILNAEQFNMLLLSTWPVLDLPIFSGVVVFYLWILPRMNIDIWFDK
jgi:hypothetical protein